MDHAWQIQEAKAKLSHVVKQAQEQPQEITLHGKTVAVVVSLDTFTRLTSKQESLVDFIRRSPLCTADDLDLSRDPSPVREVEL
ncbi:MAG: type II toxin-antitoxin system Phd/YefM family antitoxin [Pelovirga sp.]